MKRGGSLKTQLPLIERRSLIKSELNENLHKKYALELEISKQFQELKRLETSLERLAHTTVKGNVNCR
jgi:hypothetical protein